MKKTFALILFTSLLFGCSTRVTDFTIISSKSINISDETYFKRSNNRVTGEDLRHIIFLFPTGFPNMKQAIDNAIQSEDGAVALLDGVVNYNIWWIPYIYGRVYYQVEGTPLIDNKLLDKEKH